MISTNDRLIDIPNNIAVCPICKSKISVHIDEIELHEDDKWYASECGLSIDCEQEPDIDSEEWEDWHNGHYSMPYVDWLPVIKTVYDWLAKNYTFDR